MIELTLPELGENIETAEVSRLLVSEGDAIQADQNVMELESDKASFPLPSPHAGRVRKIHVKAGDAVSVGQKLMEIEESEAPAQKKEPAPPRNDDGKAQTPEAARPKQPERPPDKEKAPAPPVEKS